MHQTFYIDVDEEITSIIERIRKAEADEIVIVVPKGALLIQSIINLKLLKREVDGTEKKLIIVTQDKVGKPLVEKAGILAQQRLEDIEGQEWDDHSETEVSEKKEESARIEEVSLKNNKSSRKRLDKIGSADFFEGGDTKEGKKKPIALKTSIQSEEIDYENEVDGKETTEESEKILNRELVIDLGEDIKKEKRSLKKGSGSMDLVKNINKKPKHKISKLDPGISNDFPDAKNNFFQKTKIPVKSKQENFLNQDEFKNEKVDSFLNHQENFQSYKDNGFDSDKMSKSSKEINLPSKFWKSVLIFGLVVLFFAAGLFLYLFLPKAKVTIFLKTKDQNIDAEIKGNVSNALVDADNKVIPVKLVSFTDEFSGKIETTGEKASSSRKARGVITIYNEYSSAPQPLVATTRFLSPEGKLFRLVSGVTVPGTTNVGGEVKPGAVEAEVMADESGESFNIGATSFTIPGFQGSGNEKYSKFYAKSFKSMTGGGSGTETAKSVSEQDINSAKNKVLAEFNSAVKQKAKEQAGGEYVVLDDAVNVSDIKYDVSNSVGDIASEVAVVLKAKIEVIVFREDDLKSVVEKMMAKSIDENAEILRKKLTLDFGKVDTDFSNGSILIRVHGSGKINPEVDLENFKKGILGKTNEELEAYLKDYPKFSNVEVEYWPSFMSQKMPIYESRVEVVLDNN